MQLIVKKLQGGECIVDVRNKNLYLAKSADMSRVFLSISQLIPGIRLGLDDAATTAMTIKDLKKQVAEKLDIPVADQKLLFNGRTLVDELVVQSYPFKEGSKLNLIVKVKKLEKTVGLYEVTYRTFKKLGLSDGDASAKAKKYIQVIEERFKKYSWDDIERLAEDCMKDEYLRLNISL